MADEVTNEDEFVPEEQMNISDLETVKVIADPLRVHILELLVEKPRTVKQLASELDTSTTKLYYHINMLEQHKLIRVVSTRVVSGIIEKQYRAAANTYSLDTSVGNLKDVNMADLLQTIFDGVKRDFVKGVEAGMIDMSKREKEHKSLILLRNLSRLSQKRADEYFEKMSALVKEFGEESSEDPDDKVYSLMVALFPTTQTAPDKRKQRT